MELFSSTMRGWWNWELDPERYPEWPELVRSLEAQSIRVMTYVNPFLADVAGEKASYRRNLFAEAKEHNPLQSYHRSPELLKRWTELAAFTPVFRTHEGNRPERNAQVYSDDAALEHFARMAKVYRAWEPYRRRLVDEAADTGHPVVRHLFLHYPEDATARKLCHEEFLVAARGALKAGAGRGGGPPVDARDCVVGR